MQRRAVMSAMAAALMVAVPARASAIGDEVVAAINAVRADPPGYAQELREYRRLYRGRIVADGSAGGLLTQEGVAAVDDAIRALERQAPLPPLVRGAVLAMAAQGHADEQGPRGLTGHLSAAGETPSARVSARGGGPYVSETISYGSATPEAVVRQMVIDDGVPDRGHRWVILSSDLRFAGAGCGPHAGYRYMCVVDFGETADGRARQAGGNG